MQRSALIFLVIGLILTLAGCGGGGKGALGPPATITLTARTGPPNTASLNVGETLDTVVQVMDANKNVILTSIITYASSNPQIQVANNGLICAGTWDSLTTPVVCTPAPAPAPTSAGIMSNITASTKGITSAPIVVFVHDVITSVVVSGPTPSPVCISLNTPVPATGTTPASSTPGTQQFTAKAFHNSIDVTSTIGTVTVNSKTVPAFNWFPTDATIALVDAAGLATAKGIGSTKIAASIGGITSLPATFTVCPPQTISLHVDKLPDTSFTLAAGTTKQLAADVADTLGISITGAPLTYSSSNPVSSSISATGLVTPGSAGTSGIVASCTPPSCNSGVNYPIYSNVVLSTVTGTAKATVYVASSNSKSLVPIDTTINLPGTVISLPSIPNSLVFNRQGTKGYLGSTGGLMVLDPATNAAPVQSAALAGKVLAVSPDGKKVVISDTTRKLVLVYDTAANSFESFTISGATAADFTPDSFEALIIAANNLVAGNNLYVYSPFFSLRTITLGTLSVAKDVNFLASGHFAYVASLTPNAVTARPACDLTIVADTIVSSKTPLLVKAVTDGKKMLFVDTTAINSIAVTVGGNPSALTTGVECPPTVSEVTTTHDFLKGPFIPQQVILTSDGNQAFVTSNLPGFLLKYNVITGVTSAIALLGGGTPTFTGGATNDAISVYVGVGVTNDVHRIDLGTASDSQQITVNLQAPDGTPAAPDLVAVRPQ